MMVLIFIIALVLMIILHEAGHAIAAKKSGMAVTHFSVGFGKPLLKKKIGNTVFQFSPILLGGYVKIPGMREGGKDDNDNQQYAGKKYYECGLLAKLSMILAGPLVNILCALIIFTLCYMVGLPEYRQQLAASKAVPGTHIQQGDMITSWNGLKTKDLERNSFVPVLDEGCADVGVNGGREMRACNLNGLLLERTGDGYWSHTERQGFGAAVNSSALLSKQVVTLTVSNLRDIPFKPEARDNLSSIVGIIDDSNAVPGWRYSLIYAGLISLALGLMNLIPIFPLDGGHVVMALYEKIVGKMSDEILTMYMLVGTMALLFLLFTGLGNDLGWR